MRAFNAIERLTSPHPHPRPLLEVTKPVTDKEIVLLTAVEYLLGVVETAHLADGAKLPDLEWVYAVLAEIVPPIRIAALTEENNRG